MSAQKGSSNVDSPRSSASWAGSRYGSDDGNCDDVFNEEEDRREGPANTLASFILSSIGFTGSPFPPPSSAAAHGRRPSWRGGSGGGEGDGREIRSPSTGPPSVDQQERHQQRRRQQQEEEEHHQQQQHHHHARREGVEVYVRGRLVSELEMVVDGNGACVFADTGTMQPSSAALQSLSQLGKERGEGVGLLRDGANPVEFVYCSPYGDLSVKATFHLWGARDRVVVSDIDGTITKSDIRGYIHSVHLGSHHHTHRGIGRLFSHLEQAHHLRFVYLTSRPISLLDATRTYLANVEQDEGYGLPQGPVFTSMDSLTRVLYKELVEKTIRYMKAQVLNEISSTFHRAGRPEEDRVFLLGFGNKSADGQAYEMVGVDPDSIFIINPNSEVRMFASYKESSFSSFPRPFDWRRSLSPNAMSSEAAKRKRTSKKKGGREGEEEGIEDEEEEEGDVGPAQGVMAMSRGRYEGEGGKEGGKDEEGHTTTTFDSYSDERLLRLLERRLARDAEGKDEHENV
ncbi:lipin-like protein [Nannochloropsis oceanica]